MSVAMTAPYGVAFRHWSKGHVNRCWVLLLLLLVVMSEEHCVYLGLQHFGHRLLEKEIQAPRAVSHVKLWQSGRGLSP